MPVHLGAMPLSVQHALAAFTLGPGDVAILNDPFRAARICRTSPRSPWRLPQGRKKARIVLRSNRAHHAMWADEPGLDADGSRNLSGRDSHSTHLLARGGKLDRDLLR